MLELQHVSVSFTTATRQVQALDDVSLSLEPGQKVALVGGSGSGKSTLARTLVGLQQPDAGEVLLDGTPVTTPRWRELRQRVSMVFQDPNSSLNPRMRLSRIIAEPLGGGIDRERAAAALESVALPADMLDRYPHELSGGQRQRVAIARALVNDPEVLIADEPVSALDVSVRAQVLELMKRNVEERGLALLCVSHDLHVVAHLCESVVVMHRGKVVEQGDTRRVFESPRHPYTRSLVDAALSL